LAFEGASWTDSDVAALNVAHTLIGESTSKGVGQLNRGSALLRHYNYVDYSSSFNAHFTDSGIFGLTIEGPGSHSKDLLDLGVQELNNLKSTISEEELNRAKN
jgi:predicted Zn-dependent peptidase